MIVPFNFSSTMLNGIVNLLFVPLSLGGDLALQGTSRDNEVRF